MTLPYYIVIGTSTGGIEALKLLVRDLPPDLPAALLIVQHTSATALNALDEILRRAGPLPAHNARDGQLIERGHIYIAPADYHLLLRPPGHVRLTRGPKENRFRPAIDPLFRSAAAAFGPRVIGVVLTGGLDDGTAGLWAIKQRGGLAIVQNPEEAIAPSMPLNALKHVEVNHCVRLAELAPLLVRLTHAPVSNEGVKPVNKHLETEIQIAAEDEALAHGVLELGEPSLYACPECHGVLLKLKEGSHLRFRCHTGHAYSLESLLAEFTAKTEEALWSAIRAIEEAELLLRGAADQLAAGQHGDSAKLFRQKAEEARARAELVRQAVLRPVHTPTGLPM